MIVPKENKLLFHCFEIAPENGTYHTHVGVNVQDKITKSNLIKYIVDNNPNLSEKEVDVKSHPRWESILGYHIGLGEKECCNKL